MLGLYPPCRPEVSLTSRPAANQGRRARARETFFRRWRPYTVPIQPIAYAQNYAIFLGDEGSEK